jgi:chitin disaccharide deacetylase
MPPGKTKSRPSQGHGCRDVTKYLIVNGDDFGASPGINRGIVEAHQHGILTSTSLLVGPRWAEQAASMAAALPNLSVGLHADVRDALDQSSVDSRAIGESLGRQLSRFKDLVGRPPTHIDSHHNVHRDPRALPFFIDLAREHDLPLREHSRVRYFSKFYGQWAGQTHLEQVSVEKLEQLIASEIVDGITELSCHPGYVDDSHVTSYRIEREAELRTLCDPRIRRTLAEQQIALISYHHVADISVETP